MELRQYALNDCAALTSLFYETVHTINAKDYSLDQRNAWATGAVDLRQWNRTFLAHDTWIAAQDDTLVGFADMDASGYLDHLYVHRDHQRCGIATALCDYLEMRCPSAHFITHASITALPFFLERGYQIVRKQTVERCGVLLQNIMMEKYRL